jgi:hypothetical protein
LSFFSFFLPVYRVIGMMTAGVILSPIISSGILVTCSEVPHGANPASTMRSMALLFALARGAFGLAWDGVLKIRWTVAALAFLPYLVEMVVEAVFAVTILPASTGLGGVTSISYLAATLWASLSPSLVIPNMLTLVEEVQAKTPSYLVLCSAPLEIGTALIAYGAVSSTIEASVEGNGITSVALIPVWIVLSILLGIAMAVVLYFWRKVRTDHRMVAIFGEALPAEQLFTFIVFYLLSYCLCTPYYLDNLINVVSALSCVLAVRVLSPELGEIAAPMLKVAWAFAEVFLFVLTGVVVRGAIDSRSSAFSFAFVALLFVGNMARLLVDFGVAFLWKIQSPAITEQSEISSNNSNKDELLPSGSQSPKEPTTPTITIDTEEKDNFKVFSIPYVGDWWSDVIGRTLFLWSCTTPKATVQAALGGAPLAAATALGISTATGQFIQQSCAISILYCATIGSLLTHTLGRYLLGHALSERAQIKLNGLDKASVTTESASSPSTNSGYDTNFINLDIEIPKTTN